MSNKNALKIISEVKKVGAAFLDLNGCNLIELPIELADMFWLEVLDLNQNKELVRINLLSHLENLKELYAYITKVNDLSPLANLINLNVLDLTNTPINDLSPLTNLVNLKSLDLSSTSVNDLSPLVNLVNLKSLDLSNTSISDLSPLANLVNLNSLELCNTLINDLSPLANLINLNSLNLSNTSVNDLSPLANLVNLSSLDLSNTPVNDLRPLANLVNLNSLDLSNTSVNDLSPLANLVNLNSLDLSNTSVNDLNPLTNLTNLTKISLEYTLINDLSPLIKLIQKGTEVIFLRDILLGVGFRVHDVFEVNGINLIGCPITNPPIEIVKQGNEAIIRYFKEKNRLEREGPHVYIKVREAKILIVGQGKSGKTTLCKKLEDSSANLPSFSDNTRGIEIIQLNEKTPYTGENFRLNIWDFGGQDIQHYAHQFFFTSNSLYLLITNERIQDSVHLPYWLNIIEMLGKKSPVILIQNKDGGHCQALKDEAAIRARFGNVHNKVYQSDFSQAATEREFAELRQTIVEQASKLPHVEREYLRSFNELREKLEAEALSEKHYLRWETYLALMPELGEDLLRDYANALTFLGVCQYFPDDALLTDYVFLRPKWLIDALFELLLHPSLELTRGHFSEKDTRKIWLRPEYQGMHGLLVRMMKEFELCYRVEGEGENYIIPQRLPGENKSYGWDTTGNVPVQYRYKFMPKGVLTRLICRLHTRIEEDRELGQRVWNDAVIFTLPDGKGRVFAREVYTENTIELRATGPKHAEMLNEVIRKMDDINRDAKYENMQVEKMVPCPCGDCAKLPDNERHFFKFSVLEKALEKDIPDLRCDVSLDSIKVDSIFGQSGVTKPRTKYKGEPRYDGRMRWFDGAEEERNPLKIFISYSKKDNQHKDKLLVHLASLRDQVLSWHDHDLIPGEDWDEGIREAIEAADVVLYLVSPHSIATKYIQHTELPLIKERCSEDQCILVPIIVDYCNWKELDFAKQNALPEKGIEITNKKWKNQNEAWLEVINGVKKVL